MSKKHLRIDVFLHLCIVTLKWNGMQHYESSGFWVVFRKDLFNEEDLQANGLNPRQIKAVMYVKEKGKITNKEYQEINQVSKRTANTDLSELVHKYNIFQPKGTSVNTCYEIK